VSSQQSFEFNEFRVWTAYIVAGKLFQSRGPATMKTRSWSRVRGTKQVSTSAERRRRRNESDAGSRHSLDMSGALGHVEDTYIDRPVVLVFIPTAGKVTCVIRSWECAITVSISTPSAEVRRYTVAATERRWRANGSRGAWLLATSHDATGRDATRRDDAEQRWHLTRHLHDLRRVARDNTSLRVAPGEVVDVPRERTPTRQSRRVAI